MNNRWRGAAVVAALLLGAPAHGQSAGSQMGTGGQRSPDDDSARSTTSNQGTGAAGSEQGTTGSSGSTSSAQGTGSAGSATASAQSPGSQKLSEDLQETIQEIHAANQAEVQIAQLGAQNAQSPEVKQYAEKLGRDHQKSDEQLQQLAQTMGVNLEGEKFQDEQKEAQEHLSDLQKKQGSEFDREFMSHMVKDHKEDVKEVEKAAKKARKENQTQLASFLETTHTGLQGHLQEAKRIEQQLDQSKSQAGRGASGQTGTGSTGGTGSGGTGSTGGATSPGGGTGGGDGGK